MVARSGTMPAAGGQGSAAQVPWGWLGYAQAVTAQTGIGATLTDITSLSQAVTVGTSRRVRIKAYVDVQQQTAGGTVTVTIMEGATQLVQFRVTLSTGFAAVATPEIVLTPSAGAHTYKVQLKTTAGTVDTVASATSPAQLSIDDAGPAA